ncbi:hypothetical protein AK812_SmicGene13649 [Symbiodinium microadriaticum]|uniref:Uncharacterized protein n=1 Tax=Symbiodinium microadriaticum TaxID=2951 RepID=A0A1Q9E7K7_SYMMI|nr:hypothetical protein AK812_SmicGene13649 [Symbiodinium microadriaticum]
MEIPQQEIARSVEEAAATPVVDDDVPMEEAPQPEVDHDGDAPMNEQDYDDTRTIAQPEMELDADDNEGNDPEDVNDQFFYLTQTCMWTRKSVNQKRHTLRQKQRPNLEPKPKQNHLLNHLDHLHNKIAGIAISKPMIDGREDATINDDGTMIVGMGDLLRELCQCHCLRLRKWT